MARLARLAAPTDDVEFEPARQSSYLHHFFVDLFVHGAAKPEPGA
jgi:hypothetical protein